MTTRELVSAVVRPATKHTQRCMWEQLPADARGKPTAAISHAWDYTVTYLRDMLQNGLRGHAPLSGHTFVWLDILALTQHADGSGHQRGEIAQLGRIFGYLVPAVMQVVPAESQVHKRWFHRRNQVLGNPASSTSGGRGDLGAFDRAWCVFELANALRAGAIYDVLCPDANTNYTGPCMLTGAWNPAACKALMASDKANIDDLVLQTFGNWNTLKAMVLMVFLKANNVGPITRWDAQPFAMTAPWGMAFAGSGDVRDTLGGWQEFVDFYYEYYYEFSRQDKSQAAIAAAGLRAEGLEDLRR